MSKNVFKEMRNAEIVHMIDQRHMTKTAVAKWFNISKQRVWQIYQREKDALSAARAVSHARMDRTSSSIERTLRAPRHARASAVTAATEPAR